MCPSRHPRAPEATAGGEELREEAARAPLAFPPGCGKQGNNAMHEAEIGALSSETRPELTAFFFVLCCPLLKVCRSSHLKNVRNRAGVRGGLGVWD